MPLPKSPEMTDEFEIEIEGQEQDSQGARNTGKAAKQEPEIDVVDDTPEEDRDPVTGRAREPLPKEIVTELENDELEDYSEKVKVRLKQMKKVWHDERRAKEAAMREQQEAVTLAQRIIEENKRLKTQLTAGEKSYIDTVRNAVELEMEMAKRAYKEAYDAGDADQIMAAQEKFNTASFKMQQVNNYRPPLQTEEIEVNSVPERVQVPTPDTKTLAWQERNPWWGTDSEMTALALGFHQKLEREYGKQYIGTDEYWQRIDSTMRRRFPEYFGNSESREQTTNGGGKPVTRTESKPATVVAPASRSTSSKRIVLKQSQLNLAKKLGLTPEQYAREYAKTLEK
jgi:hypothetical protein